MMTIIQMNEEGDIMFSIFVEDTFLMGDKASMILIGKTSGDIQNGDYIFEENDKNCSYKVIGIEMVHYTNIEEIGYDNISIMIQLSKGNIPKLKGKTFKLN